MLITPIEDKKLSYRRLTTQCVASVEILPAAMQQYRNYLYNSPEQIEVIKLEDYSGTVCNKHVHSTMTRVESLSLSYMCHKQTDHGQVVYITCIPTTCYAEIF